MKQSRTAPSGATTRARAPVGRAVSTMEAPPSNPVAESSSPSVDEGSAPEPAAEDSSAPAESAPALLVFGDPAGPDTWLVAARGSLLDLLAAAREGTRRPHKRVLSRAEIRRQAREAFAGASALLDEAAQALRAAAPFMTKR
jgi:hypothetical protein